MHLQQKPRFAPGLFSMAARNFVTHEVFVLAMLAPLNEALGSQATA